MPLSKSNAGSNVPQKPQTPPTPILPTLLRAALPEDIARSLERAEKALGPGRVRYIHPDCGFWMLKRSVADRKISALAKGRDLYLGRSPAEEGSVRCGG